jgi:hypothetical protein
VVGGERRRATVVQHDLDLIALVSFAVPLKISTWRPEQDLPPPVSCFTTLFLPRAASPS